MSRAPLVFVLGCALALSACRRPPEPRALRVSRGSTDIVSLDPLVSDFDTMNVLSNAFEGLVRHDRWMAIEPALATRWASLDERTWQFELRDGVVFHDGTPFTAAVVEAIVERVVARPDAAGKRWLASVESVEAVARLSLRFRTRHPDPLLLQRLAHYRLALRPPTQDPSSAIGTGPYRLARWERGRFVELESFPRYWGGAPRVPRVRFLQLSREERLAAASRGAIDLVTLPGATPGIDPGALVVKRGPSLNRMFVWIGTAPLEHGENPLADRRVRQALSFALDRAALGEALVGDPQSAAFQLVPPTVFGHLPDLAPPSHDVDRARALLAEAGWPRGFELPMVHRAATLEEATAIEVARMLEGIGVRVVRSGVSGEALLETFDRQPGGLAVSFWTYDDGDAGSFLQHCIRTRESASRKGLIKLGYSNPHIDALIDEALTRFKENERQELYHRLARLLADEVPLVPLFDQPLTYLLAPSLAWTPRADTFILVNEIAVDAAAAP